MLGAIVACALGAALTRPLTWPATVSVLLPGIVLLALGTARTPSRRRHVGTRSAVVWIGLAVAGCLWELMSLIWGNDPPHPTLSILADPLFHSYLGRVIGYGAWLGTGAWLVSR